MALGDLSEPAFSLNGLGEYRKGCSVPKGESTVVSTSLDVASVKNVLSNVLSEATVEPLNKGPLDEDVSLAIVASQRGGLAFRRSPSDPGTRSHR